MDTYIRKFYFDMVSNELNSMHSNDYTNNITYNSLLYMDIIAGKEGCTVSFLADMLKVAKSAITVKVRELIGQGLVIKTQSEEDKRVFYLTISETMRREYNLYNHKLKKAVDSVKSKFEEDEIDVFCKVLDCFSESYNNK